MIPAHTDFDEFQTVELLQRHRDSGAYTHLLIDSGNENNLTPAYQVGVAVSDVTLVCLKYNRLPEHSQVQQVGDGLLPRPHSSLRRRPSALACRGGFTSKSVFFGVSWHQPRSKAGFVRAKGLGCRLRTRAGLAHVRGLDRRPQGRRVVVPAVGEPGTTAARRARQHRLSP